MKLLIMQSSPVLGQTRAYDRTLKALGILNVWSSTIQTNKIINM